MARRPDVSAMVLSLTAASAVVCLVGLPAVARGQEPAVVLTFEGPGAVRARNAVVAAVRDRFVLRSVSTVESAAARLDADLATPEGLADVAREQNLRVFVRGTVQGRGRRARVSVEIVDASGEMLATAEERLPRRRPERRRFEAAIAAAVDVATAELERRPPEDDTEVPAGPSRLEPDDERPPSVAPDESERDRDEPDEADDARDHKRPFLLALVGIGGRGRNATIDLVGGGERSYGVPIYPELVAEIEVRPGAGGSPGLAGIYLAADFGVALGLATAENLPGGSTRAVDTSVFRVGGRAGYLVPLGSIELGVNVGFVYETFQLGVNDTMPTTAYPSLRAGLAFRWAILEESLGLQVDGAVRVPFGTGLSPTFAESSSALGFDATAGIAGSFPVGFTYAVRGGFAGYFLSFDGPAAMARDQATGGFDGGMILTATLGWRF